MKYAIVTDIQDLATCSIGRAEICTNPYLTLRETKYPHIRFYELECEAPDGFYYVKIVDSKMFLDNGSQFGCIIIDLNKYHTIVFQPDDNFSKLGTGACKQISVLDMESDPADENSFILISELDGPEGWTKCVLNEDTLDYGISIDIVVINN